MASCSSSGRGGGDEDDWEKRRKFNLADNKRALESIVKKAKEEMKITEGKKKAGEKKRCKKGDPTYYSQGKPSKETRDASSRSKRLDYRKLADEEEEEEEEEEK